MKLEPNCKPKKYKRLKIKKWIRNKRFKVENETKSKLKSTKNNKYEKHKRN